MKARVTVTIDRDLLLSAERRSGGRSRSEVLEDALRLSERMAMARDTVAYYKSLSTHEKTEEVAWGEVATLAAAENWSEPLRRRKRRR